MASEGKFVDSSDEVAIKAQLDALAVAGNLVIVIPGSMNKVWIGKHV